MRTHPEDANQPQDGDAGGVYDYCKQAEDNHEDVDDVPPATHLDFMGGRVALLRPDGVSDSELVHTRFG